MSNLVVREVTGRVWKVKLVLENAVTMDRRQTGPDSVKWTHVAQSRTQEGAFVNTLAQLQFI
jgi:hypothetical protein